MKKLLLSALIVTGIAFSNAAMAEGKIAVIDVQAIVSKSAQVQALKQEQKMKMQELENWVKNCRADIDKQTTKEAKEKLAKKYDAELAKKQEVIAKNYKTKLQTIDKNITSTIVSQAKAKGYDMVISKSVVVFGGDDITADVQKVVK